MVINFSALPFQVWARLFLLFCQLKNVASQLIGRESLDADRHQILTAIDLVVAAQTTLLIGFQIDFLHAIACILIESLQHKVPGGFPITRVSVEDKDYCLRFIFADKSRTSMSTIVGREETIHVPL